MTDSLLPPSASPLMRAIAQACAPALDIPVPLRTLWNPWTCPVALLPWLAWTFSVDRWDNNWPEETRRRVVAGAFYLHRHKGTIAALRHAVAPFGVLLHVNEWWDTGTAPGTFSLDITLDDRGITEDALEEMERLIDVVKPCSRHLTGIALYLQVKGQIPEAVTCYGGDIMTVYPYTPAVLDGRATVRAAGSLHIIDTLEVKSL